MDARERTGRSVVAMDHGTSRNMATQVGRPDAAWADVVWCRLRTGYTQKGDIEPWTLAGANTLYAAL